MIHIGSICYIRNATGPHSYLNGHVCQIIGSGDMGYRWRAQLCGSMNHALGDDRHFLPIDDPDAVTVTTRELQAA